MDHLPRRNQRKKVVVEMPDDAPTKSCQLGRHDKCGHRLAGAR
jgi:hypothetical protein